MEPTKPKEQGELLQADEIKQPAKPPGDSEAGGGASAGPVNEKGGPPTIPTTPTVEQDSFVQTLEGKQVQTQVKAKQAVAATKISALVKGRNVRKEIVAKGELQSALQDNISDLRTSEGDEINSEHLSAVISRQILDLHQHPENYGSQGVLLEAGKEYDFPKYTGNSRTGVEHVKLPVDIWMKRTADGKGVEVEVLGQQITGGGIKGIYKSRVLSVDLTTPEHEKSVSRHVMAQSEEIDTIRGSMERFEQIPAEVRNDPNFKAAGVLTELDRIKTEGGTRRVIQARDIEAAGDLKKAFGHTPKQRLKQLGDVAKTLTLLHAKAGSVHGDIKLGNILFKEDESVPSDDPNRYIAYVADWDTLAQTGSSVSVATPGYTDAFAARGYATPIMDIYALAETTKMLMHDGMPKKLAKMVNWVTSPNTRAAMEGYIDQNKAQLEAERGTGLQSAMEFVNGPQSGFQAFLRELAKYSS